MTTLRLMTWAFDLRRTGPLEKLIAIYFASRAGFDASGRGEMVIDIVELGEWCGCKKEEAYHTLRSLDKFGVEIVEIEDLRKLGVALMLNAKGEPQRIERPPGPLMLYVVETDRGIKIGITSDLATRLANFASSSPLDIRVLLKASGPRDAIGYVESGCHAELAPHRIRGEWFSCDAETALRVARDWLRKVGLEPDPT